MKYTTPCFDPEIDAVLLTRNQELLTMRKVEEAVLLFLDDPHLFRPAPLTDEHKET